VIDQRADIHPSAELAPDVVVGPWSIIGADVKIDSGTVIGSHVVISGKTTIGKNNKIYQFASIGDAPQDLTYKDEPTELIIGDNNVFREYVMISRASTKDDYKTEVGNHNYLMAYAHVGHDCKLGNHIIMVNYAALSGHVIVEDYVNVGAYVGVHQFCRLGAYSFIGRASYVTKDVLPYIMISGNSVSACGLNSVGLKRNGFSTEDLELLRRAYKIIFRRGLTVQQAIVELIEIVPESDVVKPLINGLRSSTRGIVR
jgi:UDP-N-acetylglucosamine acyltransferase